MRPPGPQKSLVGVTLAEMLTALAVLLTLLGLLLPVLAHVRRAGQAAKCLSNLRQIYHATLTYTEENDGLLFPPLGPALEVDARYIYNNYWWQQSYLGPYAIGPRDRLKDSRGKFSQAEVELFNCPARFADAPDAAYTHANGNPAVSYVMTRLRPLTRAGYTLRMMEERSRKIYLAEGRGNTVVPSTFETGALGSMDTGKRLRRFHGGSVNLLFYDGHIEAWSGPDAPLQELQP